METGHAIIEGRTRRLGRTLCFAGASFGALGVLAWLFGVERILTVVPGLPPMMPNSAFAFFLLGVAGASVLQARSGRRQRSLVTFAAIMVLAISLGTVVEYTLDTHLFLDQLAGDRAGPYSPRPSSPPTALALALLAAGILFFDFGSGKRFRPAEWLILAAVLVAITALLAYLFGASPRYRLTGPPVLGVTPTSMRLIRVAGDLLIIGVSLSSALSLLLISLGLFLGRPDWVTTRIIARPGPGGLMVRRLAPVAVLVPIGFGVIASRLPGIREAPLVLAGLTDVTTVSSLFLLGITAVRFNRAHDALTQTEQRTRDLIEQASEGIYISDLEGRFADVNAVGCRMAGYSREEILGKTIADLLPPEDTERLRSHRAKLLEGHTDVGEWALRCKDGSYLPVEVSARILPDGRWQAFSRDISERKRAETENRFIAELGTVLPLTLEFEERLANIARLFAHDLADVCIVDVVENDGVIRRAKVACQNPTMGWMCDALMRSPASGDAPRVEEPVAATAQGVLIPKVTPDVIRSWTRTDEDCAALQRAGFQSAISVPLMAHEKALGTLLLLSLSRVYEPTDLRMVEAIAERASLLLDNARLFRAARQAIYSRDEILRIVAHDLRNPLAVIASLAGVLRVKGPEHEVGDEITVAVNRMNRLIGDLLDVTRIEAGQLSLKQERLPAAEIITDALEGQTSLGSSASLELRLEIAPELPDVWADRDRLLQVFENLIGNAIKFTKPGDRITLGATAQTSDVLFSVSDTGCGIASTHLPHVFDRFWQAPGAERRGMGFGLVIVKGIVEAHGGRVWVQSSPGQGSTFFFTIPTAAAQRQRAMPLGEQ